MHYKLSRSMKRNKMIFEVQTHHSIQCVTTPRKGGDVEIMQTRQVVDLCAL